MSAVKTVPMMADHGGGSSNEPDADQGGRDALLRRRAQAPAIRMRAITPPRTRPLPAPRAPAIRRVHRPVLQLVGDSGAFDAVLTPASGAPSPIATTGVVRFWGPRPIVFAMIAGVFALLAFAVLARVVTTGSASSARAEESSATPASTTTTMAAVMPAGPVVVAKSAPAARTAEIPVVDVKSLPTAAPAKRARAAR